ncbi:unnamed protein product [Urochloa humidicola]
MQSGAPPPLWLSPGPNPPPISGKREQRAPPAAAISLSLPPSPSSRRLSLRPISPHRPPIIARPTASSEVELAGVPSYFPGVGARPPCQSPARMSMGPTAGHGGAAAARQRRRRRGRGSSFPSPRGSTGDASSSAQFDSGPGERAAVAAGPGQAGERGGSGYGGAAAAGGARGGYGREGEMRREGDAQ